MFTITNEECLNLFEKYLVEDKKASANTLSSYMRDVRQLAEYLGANGIIDATAEELDGYISSLRSTGKSVATVSRTIASIKCLYSHLFIKQLITLNPAQGLTPEKVPQKLPEILTNRRATAIRQC